MRTSTSDADPKAGSTMLDNKPISEGPGGWTDGRGYSVRPDALISFSPLRLIEVASFGVPRAGSFIPAMTTLLSSARARGWPAEAVFGSDSKGRSWLSEFERRQIPVRFAPSASRLRLRGWFEGLLDETSEPTVIHAHFSELDVPVLLAARNRPHTAVIWHVHTPLSRQPLTVLRNVVRFGLVGRSVDLILTPSPDMAASIRRRGAPPGRVRTFLNAIDARLYPLQDHEHRLAARRSLGIDNDEHVLLHFGLHWKRKGGDLYLRAVRTLVDDGCQSPRSRSRKRPRPGACAASSA